MPPNKESIKQKILLAALIAVAVTIPLSHQLNSTAFIIFIFACLIQQPLKVSWSRMLNSKFWMIPLIYFFWGACTYFWDVSGGYTIRDLERYSILVFIPSALSFVPRISSRHIRIALMCFVAVTIAVCIICLFKSNSEYQVTGDSRIFYYHYLSEQMNLNAIFLSNYCLASITWMMYYGFVKKERLNRIGILGSCIFLFSMIFLLSSKLIIFLTLLIVLIFILVLGYVRGYFLRSLLLTAVIVIAGIFAISKLSYLSWRINVTEFKMYQGPEDDQNGIAIRLHMWKTAMEMIRERPLQGYGLRGARLEILKRYKDEFELGYRQGYHSHSQYLESALMAGIPALSLLLLMMMQSLVRGIKQKHFLLILIVMHFMIQSVFESTFEVQHELVFYIFFIFLFYYHGPGIENETAY